MSDQHSEQKVPLNVFVPASLKQWVVDEVHNRNRGKFKTDDRVGQADIVIEALEALRRSQTSDSEKLS